MAEEVVVMQDVAAEGKFDDKYRAIINGVRHILAESKSSLVNGQMCDEYSR